MLKRVIEYEDYDGNKRKEEFRFNLTKAELMEMEVATSGGMVKKIQRITEAQDGAEIMALFKDIILRSYGEKTPDGKRFIKSKELSEAFSQTEAYNILFMELVTDPDKANAFISAIIPADENKPPKQ